MSTATRELPPAPYPGLRPFSQQESRLFCGRTLERLRLVRQLESAHFLAVLGSSGSGKSSLVLSGLLPDIRSGRLPGVAPAEVDFAIFRPGRNPYANLAGALFGTWLGAELADPFFIEEYLRRSHVDLARMIDGTATERPRVLLIVVDQFEEIFRFANLLPQEQDTTAETSRRDFRSVAGDLNEAQAFITLLLTTVRECAGRVRVVTTMRSDFFKHCEVFDGLPEAISSHQFVTPRMSREQLEDAVELPLSYYDCVIDEALVNEILNDVPGEFDQLPVLQHALARMWQEAQAREGRQPTDLKREDYRGVGRLAGAMNDHGAELMQPTKPDAAHPMLDPAQVGRFFRCLGDFDSTSGQLIRRPRTLAQITAESGLEAVVVLRIARVFASAEASFLQCTPTLPSHDIAPDGDVIVDLTHECLLRKWDSYKQWMEQERLDGEALQQVTELMQQFGWNGKQTAGGEHLTPGQLHRMTEARITARAPTWATRYQADLPQVSEFLQTEQRHARNRRHAKAALVCLAVLILVGGGLFLILIRERQKATEERQKSTEAMYTAAKESVRRLEAEAKTLEAQKATASAQLQEEKARAEARDAELRAAQETFSRQLSQTQSQAQNQVVGKVGELEAKVNDLTALVEELRRLPVEKPPELQHRLKELGFASGRDPASHMPQSGSPAIALKLEGFGKINGVALLAGTEPETFDLLLGGEALHRLPVGLENGAVVPLGASAPPATRVSSWKETVGVVTVSRWPDSSGWQLVTNAGPRIGLCRAGESEWRTFDTRAQTRQAGVTRARLLPGLRVALGRPDGLVGLLDANAAADKFVVLFNSKHSKSINDVVADASGKWLLSSGDDQMAALWQIGEGLSLEPRGVVTCGSPVRSASFSPDGRWALVPSADRGTRLYFLSSNGAGFGQKEYLLELPHDDPVVVGSFSPDGRWIATATTGGAICLWPAVPVPVTGSTPQPSGAFNNGARVSALAWSPDSRLLAVGDQTGNTIVWRLKFDETVVGEPLVLPKTDGAVDALAWSPQGELLAVGDSKGVLQVHDGSRFRASTDKPAGAETENFRQKIASYLLELEGGPETFFTDVSKTDDALSHWLKILLGEGQNDAATMVSRRHIHARTNVAQSWVESTIQDGGVLPELEAYLRYLVLTRGTNTAIRNAQQTLGLKADGIAGTSTLLSMTKAYLDNPEALMQGLQDAASRALEHLSKPLQDTIKKRDQKARDFARSLVPRPDVPLR